MSMSVTLQVFTTLNVTCMSLALCSGWMALGWDCSGESSKLWVSARQSCVLADQHAAKLYRPATGALMQQ